MLGGGEEFHRLAGLPVCFSPITAVDVSSAAFLYICLAIMYLNYVESPL